VSRTSNLFLVGLLFPVLATEPSRLSSHLVILKYAKCAAPVFLARSQIQYLCAQFREFFFQRLRHGGKIADRFPGFHKILRQGSFPAFQTYTRGQPLTKAIEALGLLGSATCVILAT
jgi:hypothetical protein